MQLIAHCHSDSVARKSAIKNHNIVSTMYTAKPEVTLQQQMFIE